MPVECLEPWIITQDKITVLQRRVQWVQTYVANTFRVKQTRDAIVVREVAIAVRPSTPDPLHARKHHACMDDLTDQQASFV